MLIVLHDTRLAVAIVYTLCVGALHMMGLLTIKYHSIQKCKLL